MSSTLFTTRFLSLLALGASATTLAGCTPSKAQVVSSGDDGSQGVYYAAPNKLFDKDTKFDIRWKVTHEPQVDTFDPAINIDNRQLAIGRCTNCHATCGFPAAFDLPNYGKPNWTPRYKGEQWSNPVTRMMTKNNSFLNDAIAERIYTFLKKETTVGYDELADTKGAVTIETDESGNPIKHERATTPQK